MHILCFPSNKCSSYEGVFNSVFTHFTVRLQQKWWWSCWEVTQKTMLHKHALMPTGKFGNRSLTLWIQLWYTSLTFIHASLLSLDVLSVLSKTQTPSWSTTCSPWNLFASWRENSSMTWVMKDLCSDESIKDITCFGQSLLETYTLITWVPVFY